MKKSEENIKKLSKISAGSIENNAVIDLLSPGEVEAKKELERKEAYLQPSVRELLRKLLEKDDEQLIPIYKPTSGFIYKVGSSSNDNQDVLTKDFLNKLSRLDILQEESYESAYVCPKCESATITVHGKCPKCRSHNVDKTSLTEHIPCGYIDQKSKYTENRCPKCKTALIDGQYRNLGRWYVCKDCGERFENPELELTCRSCNASFSLKEAELIDIPMFFLNKARKKEIRQNVASLEDISKLLSELGFSVEIPGIAIGSKSGMEHHFSLIARKTINQKGITIAVDHVVSESEVQSPPLILYIYKTSEIQVDIPIFIAIPQVDETTKKIAQGHDILLIEDITEEQKTYDNIKIELVNRIEKIAKSTVKDSDQKTKGKQNKSLFNKITGFNKK